MSTTSISSTAPVYQPNAQNSMQQETQAPQPGTPANTQAAQQGMKSHHGHRHHGAREQDASGGSSTTTPAVTAGATVPGASGALDVSV